VQIGLTATPRQLKIAESTKDKALTPDNLRHFGEPVYEYGMSQGISDLRGGSRHHFIATTVDVARASRPWRTCWGGLSRPGRPCHLRPTTRATGVAHYRS